MKPPIVVATTRPFFERATTIVDETWHDLDRVADGLDRRAAQSEDSTERVVLELIASGVRELTRRLEHTEVELTAHLPAL